ncbi:MAG TPA: gamma carbonic anhydrase family protein [Thermoanaerobaculia bacterium]|jgi:carbonic anhydrase/acetyltransferase-like protein (isoleucine patch superfamily)|nr:gamma carbonic anhydrase family protein [Thermoanaerobaculia bacterium]
MPIVPYLDKVPKLGERVFIAPGAWVTGDVEVGDDVSFWFHSVARGDVNFIRIGPRTNIQDGAVLHVNYRTHSLVIGAGVVVGHQAVLHGCTIEDGALIGIAAQVLDGAVVEEGAQIGAGALVAPGHRIPAGYLALGIPARPVRPLTEEEKRRIVDGCERYVQLKEHYRGVVPPAES